MFWTIKSKIYELVVHVTYHVPLKNAQITSTNTSNVIEIDRQQATNTSKKLYQTTQKHTEWGKNLSSYQYFQMIDTYFVCFHFEYREHT